MKKVLFYALFAIATFVVTITLLAQRLSDDYMIERDITIHSTPEAAFRLIGDLKNWSEWSPWKKKDPSVEMIFEEGKTSQVGDTVSWKSRHSGNGAMTITESSAPNFLGYKLKFDDWSDTPVGEFHLIKMVDDVKVVWTMRGHRGFMDKIFWTLFKLEESMKNDFDQGLQLLKQSLETTK